MAELRELLFYLRTQQPDWNHSISEHGGLVSVQRFSFLARPLD